MPQNLKAYIKASLEDSDFIKSLPDTQAFENIEAKEVLKTLPSLRPKVIESINAARDAFCKSETGVLLAQNAMNMTPQEIMEQVQNIIALPEIQNLAKVAHESNVFSDETLGDGSIIKEIIDEYVPKSLLIQFCATAEVFVVGATIYTGFALDLSDLNTASLYVGGAIGGGAGELAAAGQGVGLTSNSYSKMTGACLGGDAGIAEGGGVLIDGSVGISMPYIPIITNIDLSSWSLVLYFLEGEGGGAEAYGGFTLKVIDQNLPNTIQAPAANSIDIYSVQCIKGQDHNSHDEIHMTVTIDGNSQKVFRYPLWDHYSIEEGETWDVGFTINFDSNFTLNIYESDSLMKSWSVSNTEIAAPGEFVTKTFEQSGAFVNDIDYNISLYTPPLVSN